MAKPKDLTPQFPILSAEEEIIVSGVQSFSDFVGQQNINTPIKVQQNHVESADFLTGSTGWRFDAVGNLEANDGNFRGDITGASGTFSGTITATTGSIGGWSISADAIFKDGATDILSAGMAPVDYPFYAGKKYVDRATAPFKVEPSGKMTCTDIVATGVINAQSGYLSAGVYVDTVNGLLCESGGLNVGNAGHIRGGQTDYETGTGFFLGYSTDAYKFSIGNATDYLKWDGTNVKLLCSSANAIHIQYGSDILLEHGGDIKFTSVTAPTACTATLAGLGAGNVDNGEHIYKITYVNEAGETELGVASNTVTVVDKSSNGKVSLTNIPLSLSNSVISRKIYRTWGFGTSFHLLATISDNTTTTYTDNTSDADLSVEEATFIENNSFGKIFVDGVVIVNLSSSNSFIGQKSGNDTTTGVGNSFIGYSVGESNTTGTFNTGVGFGVLNKNTSGYFNTSVGYHSLKVNTTGRHNTCIGVNALYTNIAGYDNTAIGTQALSQNFVGHQNTAIGRVSLYSNSTGHRNIGLGHYAGFYETGSDAFYVNNQNRTNTAGDKAKSLLYGVMAAAAADQKLTINALLNLSVSKTPASSGATGVAGDIAWDASYIYVCTATDNWERVGIATW